MQGFLEFGCVFVDLASYTNLIFIDWKLFGSLSLLINNIN